MDSRASPAQQTALGHDDHDDGDQQGGNDEAGNGRAEMTPSTLAASLLFLVILASPAGLVTALLLLFAPPGLPAFLG